MNYYAVHREYLLDYARQYRNNNKEFIKMKRQRKTQKNIREIKCEYIIRESENGPIIKKYNGIYNACG